MIDHDLLLRAFDSTQNVDMKKMTKWIWLPAVCTLLAGCGQKKTDDGANDAAKPPVQVVAPAFDADSAYAYVARQVDFGPRVPGSEAHTACATYLTEELKRHGATVTVQDGDKEDSCALIGAVDDPEIAAHIVAQEPGVLQQSEPDMRETFRALGVELMFDHIKATLHEFGVDFDVYFHENSLFESGAVDRAVDKLKENGNLYFSNGAWWLRSTNYGDDKDRVVIKSDGDAAYIAGDIAYVANKFERGHTRSIYMLGADHHGYISRLRAAAAAMGYNPNNVEVLIGQLVNLVRDGEAVRMSKRAGTIITLDDLVEAIGIDAARYSLVRSSVDSTLDIDLTLWANQSNENPVYYVQYAHARLCSLAKKAAAVGVTASNPDLSLLTEDYEGTLIRTLGEYPTVVKAAAELREPHRIARYIEELAGTFHRFYDTCQILPKAGEQAQPIHTARLALATATRQVIANALGLLGVTAPEQM